MLELETRILEVEADHDTGRLARALEAVLEVLDDYTMPGKLYDPTGIAGAELETLEGYIREAITDAMEADDA